MKKLLWFLVGIAAGFVAAHFVNKDPRGREALAELDARITEFTERMTEAYREQEASLEAIVDEAKRNAD
ncbi:ATPase [Microbacterium gorillae]|uniref:ATPase n=1 Tax=Microbacterium gorillae TaxID=1231063 RepID=UPI003D96E06B